MTAPARRALGIGLSCAAALAFWATGLAQAETGGISPGTGVPPATDPVQTTPQPKPKPSPKPVAAAPAGRLVGCKANRPSYVTNGSRRARRVVALTFDDGPAAGTPRVLDILKREKVHATFFLLGNQITGNERFVRRQLAEGHAIGDHSWNHPDLSGGGGFARSQLLGTQNRIRTATGFTTCVFRAPYGAVSRSLISIARGFGMNTIEWDVDPRDWARPGSGAIYSRVVGAVRPGSIVLMHDGGGPRGQTIDALPGIIHTLRRRGYGFVTVPELLGLTPVYR